MSAKKQRPQPRSRIRTTRVVVGFDPEALKAPFLLRCGALLIDYIALIFVPVATLLVARFFGYDGSKLLNSSLSNSGWLVAFLIAVANYFILPVFRGQSFGKLVTGIKIATRTGDTPGFGTLILRHGLGYPITLLTLGLGFVWAALSPGGKAIHDYLARTVVVYARKTVSEKRYMKRPDAVTE